MSEKKKDLMSYSMEGFWESDYKIPTHKINTPRIKSAEDDAWDAFHGRGAYAKQPTRLVADVKPVQYKPITAQDRLKAMKTQLQMQRVQAQINAAKMRQNLVAQRRAEKVIGGTIKSLVKAGASTVAYHTAPASVKLAREKAALNSRLKEMRSKRELENIRKANKNLTEAKIRQTVYNAKQLSKKYTSVTKQGVQRVAATPLAQKIFPKAKASTGPSKGSSIYKKFFRDTRKDSIYE